MSQQLPIIHWKTARKTVNDSSQGFNETYRAITSKINTRICYEYGYSINSEWYK